MTLAVTLAGVAVILDAVFTLAGVAVVLDNVFTPAVADTLAVADWTS